MNIFSFRAECAADIEELESQFIAHGEPYKLTRGKSPVEGLDIPVELETHLKLSTVHSMMRIVPDGHVMVQTLRDCPLSENSLERNFNIH